MQVKSIAECSREHSAILLTFIKLPFVNKTFVLSIFEWQFYTGFTVCVSFLYGLSVYMGKLSTRFTMCVESQISILAANF